MTRRKSRYPASSKQQQKILLNKKVESSPTGDKPETYNKQNLQNAEPSKVPAEINKFQKFINFFSSWGILLGLVPILSWGIYIQYDVTAAKGDITKNQNEIKQSNNKIIEIDKNQVGYEKELSFIKQMHQSYENRVSTIERMVKKIEIEQALQNNANKTSK